MGTQARPIAKAPGGRGLPGGRRPGIPPRIMVMASALLAASPAPAQETFMGTPVIPHAGPYKALNDANVRANPATSGTRVRGHTQCEPASRAGRWFWPCRWSAA